MNPLLLMLLLQALTQDAQPQLPALAATQGVPPSPGANLPPATGTGRPVGGGLPGGAGGIPPGMGGLPTGGGGTMNLTLPTPGGGGIEPLDPSGGLDPGSVPLPGGFPAPAAPDPLLGLLGLLGIGTGVPAAHRRTRGGGTEGGGGRGTTPTRTRHRGGRGRG